ncbi:MAG TPA: hypothetical protein VFS08_19820 [Gemmatimonadaceae bacterium]|nr:hypothetical protein [Gemmatimonadaceae bacterium]
MTERRHRHRPGAAEEAPIAARRQPPPPARWVPIATYPAVYAAEIGRAVLEAGGFDAIVEGGEWVGIFGPGFSGPTPRGVRVLVPSDQLAAARTYLAFRARGD